MVLAVSADEGVVEISWQGSEAAAPKKVGDPWSHVMLRNASMALCLNLPLFALLEFLHHPSVQMTTVQLGDQCSL